MCRLMSTISATLEAHLSSTITCCTHPPATPPHPPSSHPIISSLHSLWGDSNAPSQNIIIVSLVVLESCLTRAIHEASANRSRSPLDDLIKDMQNSLEILSSLMQRRAIEGNGDRGDMDSNTRWGLGSDDTQVTCTPQSNTGRSSQAENTTRDVDVHSPKLNALLNRRQANSYLLCMLQSVVVILYSYINKVKEIQTLMDQSPSQNIMNSFIWTDMPHFSWSEDEQKLKISALDVSLSASSSHSSVSSRALWLHMHGGGFLHHVLQLVKDNHHVLLVGPTVSLI